LARAALQSAIKRIDDFRLSKSSIGNLQSTIANPVGAAREPPPATKGPPKKKPKKLLTAHFADAKMEVIILNLDEVVSTHSVAKRERMRNRGKVLRGREQRCSRGPLARANQDCGEVKLLTRKWAYW
jgi:hypothetical protein